MESGNIESPDIENTNSQEQVEETENERLFIDNVESAYIGIQQSENLQGQNAEEETLQAERGSHRHPPMNVFVRVARSAVVEAAVSNIRSNTEDLENNPVPVSIQSAPLESEAEPTNNDVAEDNVNAIQISHSELQPQPPGEPPPTPSSTKKRKRSKSKTPSKAIAITVNDENDDGTTCPICLDEWEMSGAHRLTSLKCGHLFGHSCIKRWLQECIPGMRCCPSCKTRAQMRDLRFLYAKRVCAVDKSEEYRLKDLLETEKTKYAQLNADYGMVKLELAMTKSQVVKLETEIELLKRNVRESGSSNIHGDDGNNSLRSYRLFMEKNVEISKEPGCRVMLYAQQSKNLIVSQKSNQNLFPGYGVRFLDIENFRPLTFLHMSNKSIRDLCLNSNEDLLLSATQEKSAKLFNIHNRTIVSVFTPSDKPLWSCALDQDLNKFLYLGSQTGTTYVYDIRHPSTFVEEFKVEGDLSPVINICPVPYTNTFPYGGFLVCKLQSIWFYEYTAPQNIIPTKLNIEGPFVSMSYNSSSSDVLISTRPSTKFSLSRYIFGKLTKINNVVLLDDQVIFTGSKVSAVMSRCSQILMNNTTLIAAYLQDVKLLSLWDSRKFSRIQSLSISDVVYDTCSIVNGSETYLAALTECKCRIYRIISSEKS